MISAGSRLALAASAVAMISSQAASAAQAKTAPADPLVSLSLLGTPQSRAAVCGTGAACALPAGIQPTATAAPAAVAGMAASAASFQYSPDRRVGLDWPGLFVLFSVPVAIVLAIALEGDGNDNEPVSPA